MSDGELSLVAPDVEGAVTLVFGWKSGAKFRVRQVSIHAEVADEFRSVVRRVLDDLGGRTPEVWAPDATVETETYLIAPAASVGRAEIASPVGDVDDLATALRLASELERLDPRHLPSADPTFYALVVGNAAFDRTVFLRRNNPRRGLRPGRIYTTLSDALTKVDEPIFGFDDQVDLVFQEDAVVVLDQSAFRMIFRTNEALAALVPAWVDAVQQHAPMTESGAERLRVRAHRDSRLKRRLEAIAARGHLESVSEEKLRGAMSDLGLDPDRLLTDQGELVLEDEDIPEVLNLLNEDLFFGALTATGFRADRKARRG
jgi:hypothetical protein